MVKNPPANAGDIKRLRFDPCVWRIPWGREQQPIPAFLPGVSDAQRSLTGYTVHRVAKGRSGLKQFSTQHTEILPS